MARKRLTETGQPQQIKPRFVITKSLWMGIVAVVVLAAVIIGVVFSGKGKQYVSPISASVLTESVTVNPLATKIADKTSTPGPATAVPTTSGYADPTMYDDFDRIAYDGNYNSPLWDISGDSSSFVINQANGKLSITVNGRARAGLGVGYTRISQPTFFEAKEFLDPNTTSNGSHLYIQIGTDHGYSGCGIFSVENNSQDISCWSEYYNKKVETDLGIHGIAPGWHVLRFEVEPDAMTVSYIIDGRRVGVFAPKESIPDQYNDFKQSTFGFYSALNNFGSAKSPVGYIDYVRMGAIEDDPQVLIYDNFNDAKYDNNYNNNKWIPWNIDSRVQVYQQDGKLVLTQTSKETVQGLTANINDLSLTKAIVIQADLMVDSANSNGQTELHVYTNKRSIVCGLRSWQRFCFYMPSPGEYVDIAKTSPAQNGDWYNFAVELDPVNKTALFYINNKLVGTLETEAGEYITEVHIGSWNGSGKLSKGYIDNVRVTTIDQP